MKTIEPITFDESDPVATQKDLVETVNLLVEQNNAVFEIWNKDFNQ